MRARSAKLLLHFMRIQRVLCVARQQFAGQCEKGGLLLRQKVLCPGRTLHIFAWLAYAAARVYVCVHTYGCCVVSLAPTAWLGNFRHSVCLIKANKKSHKFKVLKLDMQTKET